MGFHVPQMVEVDERIMEEIVEVAQLILHQGLQRPRGRNAGCARISDSGAFSHVVVEVAMPQIMEIKELITNCECASVRKCCFEMSGLSVCPSGAKF